MSAYLNYSTGFRRRLIIGAAGICCSFLLISCSESDSAAPQEPDEVEFNAESVESVKQLWMDADASDTLATCYATVLKEAGVLNQPVETMSDLAAAHEAISEEQQEQLNGCLGIINNQDGLANSQNPTE